MRAPNSPDMSSLKLMSNDWERAVAARAPKTADQLMEYAEEERDKITINQIRSKTRMLPKISKYAADHAGKLYPEHD